MAQGKDEFEYSNKKKTDLILMKYRIYLKVLVTPNLFSDNNLPVEMADINGGTFSIPLSHNIF